MATKEIDFLKRQFFRISWSASTQRNPTYEKSASPEARALFLKEMGRFLMPKVNLEYSQEVSEDNHYSNIEGLMEYGAETGHGLLLGGRYKSANAQKLLNVYLKFLWCAGLITRPPHCPVDAIVLRAAGIRDQNWTEMQTLEEYRQIVGLLKLAAGTNSLADWELDVYEENA